MRTAALYSAELLSCTAWGADAAASFTAASAAASSPKAFCFACTHEGLHASRQTRSCELVQLQQS